MAQLSPPAMPTGGPQGVGQKLVLQHRTELEGSVRLDSGELFHCEQMSDEETRVQEKSQKTGRPPKRQNPSSQFLYIDFLGPAIRISFHYLKENDGIPLIRPPRFLI